jgi:hypothetical protein
MEGPRVVYDCPWKVQNATGYTGECFGVKLVQARKRLFNLSIDEWFLRSEVDTVELKSERNCKTESACRTNEYLN